MREVTDEVVGSYIDGYYVEPIDIVYLDKGTYYVCERKNESNNIMVYSTRGKFSINCLLHFFIILFRVYRIKYITIVEHRNWKFLLKHFKYYTEKETNIHVANIEENIENIMRLKDK